MVAHDAAAAHGADADLLGVALLADSGTVINIVVCAVVLLVDGVSQHQSRAAGSVQFVVMVLLNDLDVVVCAQNGRCTLAQLGQDVDAHGHIGALEHRDAAGELDELQLQFLGKTGGADHDGQLVSLTVGQSLLDSCRSAEVDDDVALAVQLVQTVVHGDAVHLAVLHVDAGHDAAILTLGDHLAQHMAHPAADALNDNIRHCYYPLFYHTANARRSVSPGICT